jgi:hypothetical protein
MLQITRTSNGQIVLPPIIRNALYVTAVIDVVVGILFFFGPEIKIDMWPSPIAPVLMRFIGGIILGNAIGAALCAQQATWEGARVIFTVALVYGVAVFFGVLYHLLKGGVTDTFWIYVIVDAVFLVPIGYIYWTYERAFRGM